MRKILWFSLIAVLSISQFGCVGKTNISATAYNIQPLAYNASFSLKAQDNQDGPYESVEDDDSVNRLWAETVTGYQFNTNDPKYNFVLTLLYTHTQLDAQWSPIYHATAIFELKIFDADNNHVDTELFKIIGMWHDGFGTLSGPVDVSAFNYAKTTRQATIQLGMLDILDYMAKEEFNNPAKSVNTFTHFKADSNFTFKPENIVFTRLLDKENTYYNESAASLIYMNFIMAEDFADVQDIKSTIWKQEHSVDVMQIVAKLAFDKKWPLFPQNLDVTALPYTFK